MSVVVRAPDGTIRLYCKGSDTKVLKKVRADTPAELLDNTNANLHYFAKQVGKCGEAQQHRQPGPAGQTQAGCSRGLLCRRGWAAARAGWAGMSGAAAGVGWSGIGRQPRRRAVMQPGLPTARQQAA